MKSSNSPICRVIVRGEADEPVELFLFHVDSTGDLAFVGPSKPRRVVGIRADRVFVFTDEARDRLLALAGSGSPEEIASVYDSMEKVCTIYRNRVDSPHAQEEDLDSLNPESQPLTGWGGG
jgi:hypothetical protein